MSLPRFATWGALGGVLLSGILVLATGSFDDFLVLVQCSRFPARSPRLGRWRWPEEPRDESWPIQPPKQRSLGSCRSSGVGSFVHRTLNLLGLPSAPVMPHPLPNARRDEQVVGNASLPCNSTASRDGDSIVKQSDAGASHLSETVLSSFDGIRTRRPAESMMPTSVAGPTRPPTGARRKPPHVARMAAPASPNARLPCPAPILAIVSTPTAAATAATGVMNFTSRCRCSKREP